MEQIYILTSEEVEELKDINMETISNIDIFANLLKKEPIKYGAESELWDILEEIRENCRKIKYALIS